LRTMSSAECRFRPAIRFIVPSRPDIGPQDSKTGWTQSAGTRHHDLTNRRFRLRAVGTPRPAQWIIVLARRQRRGRAWRITTCNMTRIQATGVRRGPGLPRRPVGSTLRPRRTMPREDLRSAAEAARCGIIVRTTIKLGTPTQSENATHILRQARRYLTASVRNTRGRGLADLQHPAADWKTWPALMRPSRQPARV
jgi:hypothetical protein